MMLLVWVAVGGMIGWLLHLGACELGRWLARRDIRRQEERSRSFDEAMRELDALYDEIEARKAMRINRQIADAFARANGRACSRPDARRN